MGFFTDWIAESDYDFDAAIEFATEEFSQNFEDYWGLSGAEPPEGLHANQWREFVAMARLAQKLASGASSLVRPRRVKDDQLALREALEAEAAERRALVSGILERLKPNVTPESYNDIYWHLLSGSPSDPRTRSAFFETCLQLEVWGLFASNPGRMGKRLGQLFEFMIRAPGEFTRAYLSRVAECYVREMPTEFAVMARAALDAAIQEVISDEQVVVEVGGSPGKDKVTLERRIQACRSKGWFPPELGRAADSIRANGRDAAHFSPGLEVDFLQVLRTLSDLGVATLRRRSTV